MCIYIYIYILYKYSTTNILNRKVTTWYYIESRKCPLWVMIPRHEILPSGSVQKKPLQILFSVSKKQLVKHEKEEYFI